MLYIISDEGIDYSAGYKTISLYGAKTHIISADEEGRPDLIAYDSYGDPSLWWAICVANGMMFGYNEQFRFKAYDDDSQGKKVINDQQDDEQYTPDFPSASYYKDIPMHNGTVIYDCFKSELCIGRTILLPTEEAIDYYLSTADD